MKLTKSQERKLRKKLKVNSSAEDLFVSAFMNSVKKEIGTKIKNASSIGEVDAIISNIDSKKLNYSAKNLRNKILSKNNTGIEAIIKSMTSGLDKINQKKKENKIFEKEMRSLIKKQHLVDPLMEKFEYNISLIKNLPTSTYNSVRKVLLKGYLEGKSFRGTEIEEKLYDLLGARAKLIVRTESAKVNSALTEVRARSVGVKAYVWSSSMDSRVRDSHRIMNDVLVFWNNAPTFINIEKSGKQNSDTYHCGETFNCRCVELPVFDLDDIKFPVKVAENAVITTRYLGVNRYSITQSGITKMTKKQFLIKYGNLFLGQQELNKIIGNS